MIKKRRTRGKQKVNGFYQSPNVPMSAIRRFARQVAERFQPDKIILFGSYAYGKPHRDSDVDILVVMACHDEINQSVRIWQAIDPPFSLDLIVRTPRRLQWRIKEGDWFLREVMERGKILYEKTDQAVGSQGRGRLHAGKKTAQSKATVS
jgi:predicted nucleotidyltransferase